MAICITAWKERLSNIVLTIFFFIVHISVKLQLAGTEKCCIHVSEEAETRLTSCSVEKIVDV